MSDAFGGPRSLEKAWSTTTTAAIATFAESDKEGVLRRTGWQ